MRVFNIDLNLENIPISANNKPSIVGDIRLDNAEELQSSLNIEKSQVDDISELVIQAYMKWGLDFAQYLYGAFSFVIVDGKEQRVIACVDQIGVKPLYYNVKNKQLRISNKKGELLDAGLDKSANWDFITRKLITLTSHLEQCEYQSLTRLLPAHLMVFSINAPKSICYWDLNTSKTTHYSKEEDYFLHFQELVEKSIAARIKTEKNFGTHLSGGLDSSGITGVAAYLSKEAKHKHFVFGYSTPDELPDEYPYSDENDYIDMQLEFSEIENYFMIEEAMKFNLADVVRDEAQYLDGYSRTNNLATEYEIQATAKEHNVDVILSGFPGDELASSFVNAYFLEYLERGEYLKFFSSKHKKNSSIKNLFGLFMLNAYRKLGLTLDLNKLSLRFLEDEKSISNKISTFRENNLFLEEYIKNNNSLKLALTPHIIQRNRFGFPFTLKEYQKNHLLREHTSRRMESENLAGMRFGVEHRYPLADVKLVEYILSIPVELKRKGEKARYIYSQGMKKYSPSMIMDRNDKQGSIKPLGMLQNRKKMSLLNLYLELKRGGFLGFMDTKRVDSMIEKQIFPEKIDKYLIIGQLNKINKINI